MKRSVLPLALVLVAAPFFSNYRDEPVRFGVLQGLLVAVISVVGAGGLAPLRERLRKPAFAAFWIILLALSVAAPFMIR